MNEGLLIFGLAVAGGIGMVVFVVWAAVRHAKKTSAQVVKLGEALGLGVIAPPKKWFDQASYRLEGTYRGRPARVWSYTTGSGKSRTTWCAIAVGCGNAPNPMELSIQPEGLGWRIAKAFGARELEVGEAAFDREFMVRAKEPAFAAALLPEIRERLLAFKRAGGVGTFKAEPGELIYTEQGFFSEKLVARFPAAAEIAVDLADAVEVCRQVR
jgi:hypothetical protein